MGGEGSGVKGHHTVATEAAQQRMATLIPAHDVPALKLGNFHGTMPPAAQLSTAIDFARTQKQFGNKYIDTMEYTHGVKPGLSMAIAKAIKAERFASGGGGGTTAAAGREDMILRIRDSSGRATARKF